MMSERSATAVTFKVGEWSVEPAANRLLCVDREIRVEPKVMRVLAYLMERHGEVVSRHDLEANVWTGMIVTDDAVTNTVIKLRKALGDNARNPVNDHLNGAIPGSVYWSHPGIGLMEPPQDRPIGAT